jgi:hypothetical protein
MPKKNRKFKRRIANFSKERLVIHSHPLLNDDPCHQIGDIKILDSKNTHQHLNVKNYSIDDAIPFCNDE